LASSSYASVSDLTGAGGYLRDANVGANTAILNILSADASRMVDDESGQFFYDDGASQRWINGIGGSRIDTSEPFFFSSGTVGAASKGATSLTYTASTFAPRPPVANEAMVIDVGANREVLTPSVVTGTGPYTLTVPATGFAHAAGSVATTIQITVAYFENQPVAQWIQELDGDGWNPASNFYVWPNRVRRVGAANQGTPDNLSTRPWMAFDLPMIPISATTWLPTTMIGKATVGVTAHWGWPVVPDFIRDLTCRAVSLMWRKRQAGQGDSGGSPMGTSSVGEARALIKSELAGTNYKLTYI
jgi:hypothetical protein